MKRGKIEQYRQQLIEMRTRSRDELNRVIQVIQEDARPIGEHDRGTSESLDKEIEVENTEEQMRRQINDAIERIESGSFGKCEKCNGTIPEERLDAIPYTPYCVGCEREFEATQGK